MTDRTNEFGQPIGFALPAWEPPPALPKKVLRTIWAPFAGVGGQAAMVLHQGEARRRHQSGEFLDRA